MAKGKKNRATEPATQTDALVQALALSAFAYAPTVLPEDYVKPTDPFGKENYNIMKGLLKKRVKPSRYAHSVSVAKTAKLLAQAYDYDANKARMAGLLHDWDKGLTDEHLRCRVHDCDLDISEETLNDMPWVLHGMTGAAVLADEFPEFGTEVFDAISRHTLGAPGMGELDMIVFVADKIEPLHKVKAFRRLYKMIGVISLEQMFFEVQRENFRYLVSKGRPLCYESTETWNWTVNHLVQQ